MPKMAKANLKRNSGYTDNEQTPNHMALEIWHVQTEMFQKCKIHADFKDLEEKRNIKYLIKIFILNMCQNDTFYIFRIKKIFYLFILRRQCAW